MQITMILHDFQILLFGPFPDGPIGGLCLNLLEAFGALGLGFILSIPLGLARKSEFAPTRWLAMVFMETIKAIPILLLVFWAYLLLPQLVPIDLPPLVSALLSFTVYSTVYLAEILRAGLESIPRQQRDAAVASGMHTYQWHLYLSLPQAIRRMIPCYASFFISIFKDTSVLYIIGIMDIIQFGLTMAESHPDRIIHIYGQLGLCLFLVCQILGVLASRLEKRFEMPDCQICRVLDGIRPAKTEVFVNKPTF